jgi:hypothetical protein
MVLEGEAPAEPQPGIGSPGGSPSTLGCGSAALGLFVAKQTFAVRDRERILPLAAGAAPVLLTRL